MAADRGAPLLEVNDLIVRYGDRTVLDGLSFTVGRGEIFGLLGPNGSGKSTTFSVLTGLLAPAAGRFRFDGADIEPGARSLRARIGVVFQKPSLDKSLSGRENLMLAARLHGVPRADRRARVAALLELAELADRADEPVKKLSGGMARRLELARSLVHEPILVVMDEPTSGLDERSFQRTWDRLERLRRERGLSILVSTHRPEEAARCDRIALIDDGKLVACDTPEALRTSVSGDLVTLVGADAEALAALVRERFGVEARVIDNAVSLRCDEGHALIPRIVEALPAGRLKAVHLERPGLAEVFLARTGRTLDDEGRPAAPLDRATP